MAERKIKNNTILLFLGEDAGNLDTIVCLTSVKNDFTIDELDATTNCGERKEPGNLSGTISCDGYHLLDPSTGKKSGHDLFEWMVARQFLFYKIGPAIPDGGDVIQTGECFITTLGNAYTYNTQSSFAATFSIVGTPVELVIRRGIRTEDGDYILTEDGDIILPEIAGENVFDETFDMTFN